MSQKTVVTGPMVYQKSPIHFSVALESHQFVLFVSGESQAALQCGTHETLVIIRSRVEQMAENFFLRPFLRAWTDRCISVGQLCKHGLGLGDSPSQVGSDGGEWITHYSIPKSFHFWSTSDFVFSSIRISSGQGRVKPSAGHFRVASMPIFEPKFGSREAWSSESTGPR